MTSLYWVGILRGGCLLLASFGILLTSTGCGQGPAPADPTSSNADQWIRFLSTGDPPQRIQAVAGLGKLRKPQYVEYIVKAAVSDRQIPVRVAAVEALGQPGLLSEKDVRAVVLLMSSGESEVRMAACRAISAINPPDAAESLLRTLHDRDSSVRLAAADSLVRLGPSAVTPLTKFFESATPDQKSIVASAVAKRKDPSYIDILRMGLKDDDDSVRRTCAESLGAMRDPSSVPALMGLVTDPLSPARLAEIQQRVHQRPNESDYQLMIKILDEDQIRNHQSPDRNRYSWLRRGQHTNIFQRAIDVQRSDAANLVRISAIQAVTNIAPANLESLLIGLLGNPDNDVGSMASRVLRERGDSVRALLIQTAVDTKVPARVRVRAMETLIPLVHSATKNESDRLRKVLMDDEPVEVGIAEEPVAQVVNLPQDVEKLFVTLLSDADNTVRLAAVIHLGEAGVKEVIAPLLETFRKCDPSLVESVTTAIASFKDDRIAPVLTAALGDERYSANRYAIVRTLGVVGDKRATPALISIATESNDIVLQDVAIEALGGIRDPSADQTLIRWFKEVASENEALAGTTPPTDPAALTAFRARSSRVYQLVSKLIGYFGAARVKDAVPVLTPLLGSEKIGKYGGLTTTVMATLGKIGDVRAVGPISELISKGGSYHSRLYVNHVTKGGIDAIVAIGDPSGIPVLKRLAAGWQNPNDPFTGKYAIEGIGRMRHPDAVKVLMDFLTDPQIDTSMHDACVGPALAAAGPVARDPLLKLLSESPKPKEGAKVDPGMYAAQILGVMEKPEVNVIPPLARILASSPPPYIAQRVTEALAQTRHEAAIESLGEAMRKGDSLTRAQSALALGKTRLRSAIPHLKAGLSDKDTKVAECAATSLLEILIEKPDKESIPDIIRILAIKPPQGIVLRVVDALSQLRQDEAVDGLAEIMVKADPFVKGFVAGAMGKMRLPRALPHLRNALSDSSPEVRESAAASLLDIVLERIEPAILPDLASVVASKPSALTIQRATEAMAEMHAESAVRALGDMLKTGDATARELAANALGKIRLRSAIPLLKNAQTDTDEKVKKAATASLTVYGFGAKAQKKEPST